MAREDCSSSPMDKLARRLERKAKRRAIRKGRRAEEKARLECEHREVEEELGRVAALREEEEEAVAEGRLVLWCQRCLRRLRQASEHSCVFRENPAKCEYCLRQGRGRHQGVEACRPVPVEHNDLARRLMVRREQLLRGGSEVEEHRFAVAAKALDYAMRARPATPRRGVSGGGGRNSKDGVRICGDDFRLLCAAKRFMVTPGGASFIDFMQGGEEGGRGAVEVDLSGGRLCTPSPPAEGHRGVETPPSMLKSMGRAVGRLFW